MSINSPSHRKERSHNLPKQPDTLRVAILLTIATISGYFMGAIRKQVEMGGIINEQRGELEECDSAVQGFNEILEKMESALQKMVDLSREQSGLLHEQANLISGQNEAYDSLIERFNKVGEQRNAFAKLISGSFFISNSLNELALVANSQPLSSEEVETLLLLSYELNKILVELETDIHQNAEGQKLNNLVERIERLSVLVQQFLEETSKSDHRFALD